ncbi:hypothetical protein GNP61_08255 [Aliivibrio fischeri]|uniref:hypothetical protein n=1 Tax=Aliivibrio fischeri TaxID=668 RepID=UPI0012DA36DF|nr:hypothetical protein [Aliivibrio fischeri]MUK41553.1 hypothetical protein [Aliivibrio fischeri]
MKTKVLATLFLGCVLSGSAFAEKVTYDKAVADSKAYEESLPHYENATTGLSSAESNSTATANQMGKWVRLSLIPFDNAGSYSKILTSKAIGAPCIKGSKGIIPTTKNSSGNCSGSGCDYWQTVTQETYNYSKGYTAECR